MDIDEDKKIVDLTAEELAELGYLTDKVAPGVKKRVEKVLANPRLLDCVTVFMVECMKRITERDAAYAAQRTMNHSGTPSSSHPQSS